jgi:hypothetical protein
VRLPDRAGGGHVKRWGRGIRPESGVMNRLELAYSLELEARKQVGEVLRWEYVPERLRLADRTFYTPDFRVQMPDGTIEFHETKGFTQDAGLLRIKLAAELHPYRFRLVKQRPKRDGGGWDITEI